MNHSIHIKGDKIQFDRRRSKCYPLSPCTILVNQKVNHEEHPLQLELVRTKKDFPESITHSVRKVDQTNTAGNLLNSIQSLKRGIKFKAQLQYHQAQKEEFGIGFQRTCLEENSNSKLQRKAGVDIPYEEDAQLYRTWLNKHQMNSATSSIGYNLFELKTFVDQFLELKEPLHSN